jgi:ribosomal protein S13
MRNDEEIKKIKQELLEKYNIKTDRDLIQQLGIRDEDKIKLFAWIRYQCAFSYREGFIIGQDETPQVLEHSVR